ncbi:MAG: radical SAM protein [Elusimicrobiota bacterium]
MLNKIWLSVTDRCNLNCKYCYVQKKFGHMSLDVAKQSVIFLCENSEQDEVAVNFFGGEPFMNFEVIKGLILYGKEAGEKYGKNIKFVISTNGTLFTDDKMEFLRKYKNTIEIDFSLDGICSRQDRNRPAGEVGSYRMIVENDVLEKIKEFDNVVYITILPDNIKGLAEDVEELHRKGFNRFRIQTAINVFGNIEWKEQDLNQYENELEKIGELFIQHYLKPDCLQILGWNDYIEGTVKGDYDGCVATLGAVNIYPNGDVYPCDYFYQTTDEKWKLGNIFNEVNLGRRKKLDKLVEEMVIENGCYKCESSGNCFEKCIAVFLQHNKKKYCQQEVSKIRIKVLDKIKEKLKPWSFRFSNLELYVTDKCNLKCDYCFEKFRKPDTMSLETLKRATQIGFARAETDKLDITFFGGEPMLEWPLLKKYILWVLDEVKKYKKKTAFIMTTNGMFWNDDIEEFMKNHSEVIFWQVSLDGIKKINDRHRGKGTTDTVVENLKKARKIFTGSNIGIRATLLPDSVKYLSDSCRFFWEDLGIRGFSFAPAFELNWKKEDLATLADQLEKALDVIEFGIKERDVINEFINIIDRPLECNSGGRCGAGRGMLSVTPDGSIYPCHRFYCSNTRYRLGDVWNGIQDYDRYEFFRRLEKRHFIKCSDCEISYCCACMATSEEMTGSILLPAISGCQVFEVIDKVMWLKGWPRIKKGEGDYSTGLKGEIEIKLKNGTLKAVDRNDLVVQTLNRLLDDQMSMRERINKIKAELGI